MDQAVVDLELDLDLESLASTSFMKVTRDGCSIRTVPIYGPCLNLG